VAFTCPDCRFTSHNPNDEAQRYCVRCHAFIDDAHEGKVKLVGSKSTPGQHIRELHVWVATYADGTEGIVAGGFEGVGLTPLMSSRRELAKRLESKACAGMALTEGSDNPIVGVRLVTFTSTEGTRQ